MCAGWRRSCARHRKRAREELTQRHFFAAKSYTDSESTLRFTCEAPVRLEARLGAYARAMRLRCRRINANANGLRHRQA